MIHNFRFQTNPDKQEILPMNAQEFPFLCNYGDLDTYINRSIPWHWHSSLELDYIAAGTVLFQTPDVTEELSAGSMVFINAEAMHDIRAKDHQKGCRIYAHLFHPRFLSGNYNSLFDQKYMLPITGSAGFYSYIIRPDSYRHLQMIERFLKIVDLNEKEPFGYEFEERHALSQIWCMLLEETSDIRPKKIKGNINDTERLKLMMEYIQTHYMEKLSVDEIASAASISARECTRCFQRCIRLSPIHYLNEYRLQIAAQKLSLTNDSIMAISEDCGFSSSSYFGKAFFAAMGCTPREYRQQKQ